MDSKEYFSKNFVNVEVQAREVRAWKANYFALTQYLGIYGTEIHKKVTFEIDQDNSPFYFVRGAVHEFVFPAQDVTVVKEGSRSIDSTPGYTLTKVEKVCEYNKSLIKGHLRVEYDDALSRINFSVLDMKGESELSEDVLTAVKAAFAPAEKKASA